MSENIEIYFCPQSGVFADRKFMAHYNHPEKKIGKVVGFYPLFPEDGTPKEKLLNEFNNFKKEDKKYGNEIRKVIEHLTAKEWKFLNLTPYFSTFLYFIKEKEIWKLDHATIQINDENDLDKVEIKRQ